MARPIRVLIVDDSALVRHRLRTIVGGAPGFEVVAALSNVRDCLAQLRMLQPDVITLDIWMPEMDGLTALRHIMAERPTPVVMVSSLTQAGAHVTLEALALGATDFVTKPSAISTDGADPFRVELLSKLSIAAAARPGAASRSGGAAPTYPIAPSAMAAPAGEQPADQRRPAASNRPVQPPFAPDRAPGKRLPRRSGDALVVIGSSTGGPQVLDRLFTDLGDAVPAAILVVQHIPELFTPSLAARLGRRSGMEVHEAKDGDALVSGVGLVARGGWHVTLGPDQRLHLDQSAPVHGVRPAVDRALFSIAEHWRGPCLTVILTGMGSDGTPGARAMCERGGEVFAQDESTSIVYGMPRSVVEAGLASAVLPIDQMAAAIRQWARPAALAAASAVQTARTSAIQVAR